MRMVQNTKFKVRYEKNSRLSLTDPIYEVDKSNKILLPLLLWKLKAIGWFHYVEFRTVQKVYQLKFSSFFKVSMGQSSEGSYFGVSSLLTFEQQREKRLPFKKTEYKNSLFGGWAIKIQGNSAIFLRSGDSPFTLSKTQFDSNKKKNRNMIKKFGCYSITKLDYLVRKIKV